MDITVEYASAIRYIHTLLFIGKNPVLHPKKSLGQNFLQDDNVSHKIVRLFAPSPGDRIVEIGPGKGALTELLLKSVPHLTLIELDDHLAEELRLRFGEAVTVVHNDVLKVPFESFGSAEAPVRVIGNIPYNITTPILFHIVDARAVIKDFMVMMQTEVAQRLVAQPRTKEYGILTVFLQYYCRSKILFSVSKNSFFPVPSVSSTVVHLDFSSPSSSRAADDRLFRRIVRGTFGTRRKTLRNGLRNIGVPVSAFDRLSVDLELRPEELTVHDFVKLSNELIHLAGTIVIPGTEEPHE
jgi:16S rRNA (adenine1518-N6/adenine1519-N6)-dimethyltransferase